MLGRVRCHDDRSPRCPHRRPGYRLLRHCGREWLRALAGRTMRVLAMSSGPRSSNVGLNPAPVAARGVSRGRLLRPWLHRSREVRCRRRQPAFEGPLRSTTAARGDPADTNPKSSRSRASVRRASFLTGRLSTAPARACWRQRALCAAVTVGRSTQVVGCQALARTRASSRRRFFTDMSPARMSRLESAIRVVLEFNEAFNRHDVAGMMQLMSDDCIFENTNPAPDGAVYSGKEAVTRFGRTSSASRLRPTSRSRRFLALASGALCAGDTVGWTWQGKRGMSEELTYFE